MLKSTCVCFAVWRITGHAWISWATKTWWRTAIGNGRVIFCLVTMVVSAASLPLLLLIGGVEKNPVPGVEPGKIMAVLCSGCDRNLKSGTQYDTCGRWFSNSCGNVKFQVAESGKWICDKCRSERLGLLG